MKKYITYLADELSEASINVIQYLIIAILSTIFDFVKTSITYFKGAKDD